MQFVGYVRHEQDLRQFNKVKESGCPYLHAGYFTEFSDAQKGPAQESLVQCRTRPGITGTDVTFRLNKHTKTGDDTSL